MSAAIDIIDEATDGTRDGQIGSGSRIAVVSFADTASKDTQLITPDAAIRRPVRKKLFFSKNVLTDLEPCGIIHIVLSD